MATLRNVLLYIFVVSFTSTVFSPIVAEGCVIPTGIGDADSDIYTIDDLSSIEGGNTFSLWILMNRFVTGQNVNLFTFSEPAIQFRVSGYVTMAWYTVLSSYDEIALEIFGRKDVSDYRRRCVATNETSDYFELHRSVAYAYAIYYSFKGVYNISNGATDIMNDVGLIPDLCENCQNYNSCISCNDISTPWGLAHEAAYNEINLKFIENDGWNAPGSYNREYNRIPYSDFRDSNTRYVPVNDPWTINDIQRWQPLLESDGLGFLFHQEHVVPHIGFTGKSVFFKNDEICDKISNDPEYDYDLEMNLAIDRLANLTEKQKMVIEMFDDKSILNRFRGQYRNAISTEDANSLFVISNFLITNMALHEAMMVVWKEKINWDLIRPPSIIHQLLKDDTIVSYAGVTTDGATFGTQTMSANDWEPYIRTMPHSEYPSASACVCQSWADAQIEFFGTDNVTDILPNGFQTTFSAFSSAIEPLSTPSQDITVSYSSFSEVAQACAQSRIDGGMHFTESIIEGANLCSNIGDRIARSVNDLVNGKVPEFIIDIDDPSIEQVVERFDCYRDVHGHGSDSSSHSSSHSSSDSSGSS